MRNFRLALMVTMLVLAAACAPAVPSGTAVPASPASRGSPPASPSPGAVSASPSGQPVDAWVDGVGALIQGLVARGEFSGVALVARGDEVAWEAAAGPANRESNTRNGTATKLNLGSMNKMFTAVSILQLVEMGELALDDTIAEHLPDYPNREVARSVTIHQLLTHTSGLGDTFTATFNADPHAYRSNADYLPLFVDEPLLFDPGSGWSYSNAGFVVLGLIVEQVSGQTYDTYVRDHVFEPAGMLDTAAYEVEETRPDLAIGYTTVDIEGRETGVVAANTDLLPGRGFAAGGGYSTVGDLLRFRTAILSHRLLDPASTEMLLAGKVDMAEGVRYAYGFMDRVDAGVRAVGHTGGAPGICSFLWIYPATDHTVIVLSNSDAGCVPVLRYLQDNPPRQEG
jgi:CubicO group peptidase (beta-lactamase class C family)